jgi:hypothetical protein
MPRENRKSTEVHFMLRCTISYWIILGLLVCRDGVASSSKIEDQMTPAELISTGVVKLNQAERQALNDWLSNKSTAVSQPDNQVKRELVATADAATGFLPANVKRTIVESKIQGSFRGWSGATEFTLENGQVWRQSESGAAEFAVLQSPIVKIIPKSFGSWLLKVEGIHSSLRVRRVR